MKSQSSRLNSKSSETRKFKNNSKWIHVDVHEDYIL